MRLIVFIQQISCGTAGIFYIMHLSLFSCFKASVVGVRCNLCLAGLLLICSHVTCGLQQVHIHAAPSHNNCKTVASCFDFHRNRTIRTCNFVGQRSDSFPKYLDESCDSTRSDPLSSPRYCENKLQENVKGTNTGSRAFCWMNSWNLITLYAVNWKFQTYKN